MVQFTGLNFITTVCASAGENAMQLLNYTSGVQNKNGPIFQLITVSVVTIHVYIWSMYNRTPLDPNNSTV